MSVMPQAGVGWGWALVVGALVAVSTGCGDDDAGGTTTPGGGAGSVGGGAIDVQQTFPGACGATLQKPSMVGMPLANLPSAWENEDSTPQAPVGTTFLLEADSFGDGPPTFRGYTFSATGVPQRLTGADSFGDLTIDVDFTSSCAAPFTAELTTLRTVTIYPENDLSGTPCTLPPGTRLGNVGYALGNGGVGGVFSGKLADLCGFDEGYSKDYLAARIAYVTATP
jgi:hypothetical protein